MANIDNHVLDRCRKNSIHGGIKKMLVPKKEKDNPSDKTKSVLNNVELQKDGEKKKDGKEVPDGGYYSPEATGLSMLFAGDDFDLLADGDY